MAKMKMKVDVNTLELDVLERVVNKPVEYDVDYFTDRGLYELQMLVNGEPHLYVVAVSPEGKYIKQYVVDEVGNYAIVDECIQTEIVPCDSLEIRDSKGNPVTKELWW